MSSKLRKAANCLVMEIEHRKILEYLGMFKRDTLRCILKGVKDALDEPVLNCEVGTADEQEERHDEYCVSAMPTCRGVSTRDCIRCFARWSQMPYEEGESDEQK